MCVLRLGSMPLILSHQYLPSLRRKMFHSHATSQHFKQPTRHWLALSTSAILPAPASDTLPPLEVVPRMFVLSGAKQGAAAIGRRSSSSSSSSSSSLFVCSFVRSIVRLLSTCVCSAFMKGNSLMSSYYSVTVENWRQPAEQSPITNTHRQRR